SPAPPGTPGMTWSVAGRPAAAIQSVPAGWVPDRCRSCTTAPTRPAVARTSTANGPSAVTMPSSGMARVAWGGTAIPDEPGAVTGPRGPWTRSSTSAAWASGLVTSTVENCTSWAPRPTNQCSVPGSPQAWAARPRSGPESWLPSSTPAAVLVSPPVAATVYGPGSTPFATTPVSVRGSPTARSSARSARLSPPGPSARAPATSSRPRSFSGSLVHSVVVRGCTSTAGPPPAGAACGINTPAITTTAVAAVAMTGASTRDRDVVDPLIAPPPGPPPTEHVGPGP